MPHKELMNYLISDRASETAASDLAEVRRLIEGMSALIDSQLQQQQQLQNFEYPLPPFQQDAAAAFVAATFAAAAAAQQDISLPTPTTPVPTISTADILPKTTETLLLPIKTEEITTSSHSNATFTATNLEKDEGISNSKTTANVNKEQENQLYNTPPSSSFPSTEANVIIEVAHLTFDQKLYFQLSPAATIEPLMFVLRQNFKDSAISGMVLQYKGFDGLWKCLLNRDDSLKRVLQQSVRGNTMLQMRVPRKEDLLSSGYTDHRLLTLTRSESM